MRRREFIAGLGGAGTPPQCLTKKPATQGSDDGLSLLAAARGEPRVDANCSATAAGVG
jgi:hypothetical protein